MNIQLSTGKTVSVSTYDWLFVLQEDAIEDFYKSCLADDLGVVVDNPFSNRGSSGIAIEEEIDEIPED